MRKVAYRAWSISKEYYVLADMLYIQANPIWGNNEYLDDMGTDNEFKPNDLILEQFTGMYDRNARRIHEGDILLVNDPSSYAEDYEDYRYLELKYDVYCYYLVGAETVTIEDILDGETMDAEVVGNIHENKNLLK